MATPNFTIRVNAFEAGVLISFIENLGPPERQSISGLRRQLIAIRKEIDKLTGVVKTLLPDGRLETIDADGNRFVRPPYSWEVEGN